MKWSAVRRKLGRVDRAIDKSIASAEIPGAVVGARMPKNGETLEHFSERGLAVLQPERIPMTRRTIFDLASLTKPLATTTAILLLLDEGVVELHAPVAK
ncbi:MAG: serine hydrolase, partial [Myxococcota bacterium]